jgi:hypothetical protein
MDINAVIAWLKQPSTIKAIMVLAGLIGVRLEPTKMQEIIEAGLLLYAGVQAFYNQQPRKPADPVPPAETPLTEESFKRLLAESRKAKQQV